MTFENFIPPRSKTVLEVTGKVPSDFETTDKKFLEIQPDCKYTIAENISDINNTFDTILLQNDFIGKLDKVELVEIIKSLSTKLNKRGTLLFTLDNIAFAGNLMAILNGDPPLFKTTLTQIELEESIAEAGYNKLRSLTAARKTPVARGVAEASKVNLAVFKHIISATPEDVSSKLMIQTIVGEKLACAPMRIFTPNSFMMTEPGVSTSTSEPNKSHKFFGADEFQNRVFINQRMSYPTFTDGVNFFHEMQKRGYLYLEEMDDHPFLWKDDYDRIGFINFVGVHAIQTSTEYLADYMRELNPHVKVFANHLRRLLPLRDFDEEFKQDKPVTIFFGALNRDNDFMEILPIINRISEEYGDKVAFKVIARQKLFNAIESKNKTLVGNPDFYDGQFVSYPEYENTLRTSDIALLPLLDNNFNRSKSDLKFIESAGCGTVVLASPVVYGNVVKDGVNGFIFNNAKEFYTKLKILIDNRDKRRDMAQAAYDYVKHNRLLSQHYEERLDWYREMLQRLPELNRETQARIDKLAPKFEGEKTFAELNKTSKVEGNSAPNAEIIIPSDW